MATNWHWIEGERTDSFGRLLWIPLFSYRAETKAQSVLDHILRSDSLPSDLSEFFDFRLHTHVEGEDDGHGQPHSGVVCGHCGSENISKGKLEGKRATRCHDCKQVYVLEQSYVAKQRKPKAKHADIPLLSSLSEPTEPAQPLDGDSGKKTRKKSKKGKKKRKKKS